MERNTNQTATPLLESLLPQQPIGKSASAFRCDTYDGAAFVAGVEPDAEDDLEDDVFECPCCRPR